MKRTRLLHSVLRSRSGATAVEYGLIAALISVVIIAGLLVVQGELTDMYTLIETTLSAVLG